MSVYKPKFDATKYRPDVPEHAVPTSADEPVYNVTLEPYVPDRKKLLPPVLHTRTHRFGALTAEPLKPAVVFTTQGTQTDDVVVSAAPESYMYVAYQPYKRPEAAELLSENIRLQREVDALELRAEELRLAYEKISLEQQDARAAEERRLAEHKMHLEQQDARAEERRLAEQKIQLEQLNARAEERRLEQLNMRGLQNETRPKLPQLARQQPAKPAQPARPAQPPARTRTNNRAGWK